MREFLLVLAIIWFVLCTCIGNYMFVSELRKGKNVTVKTWTVMLDIVVVAYLIARALGHA